MTRFAPTAAALAGAAALLAGCGGSSSTTPAGMPHTAMMRGTDGARAASLVIRHQTQGCHSWSLNGMPFAPHQVARLQHGNGVANGILV